MNINEKGISLLNKQICDIIGEVEVDYEPGGGLWLDSSSILDAANEVEKLIFEEVKRVSIEYAQFRDTYPRYESQKMHIHHQKLGGLTTWRGTSDESIYEAYLKGEQHYNPLIKEMEDLKLKGGSANQ
ncbi:MAG: hypothetical protein IPJ81_06650 [Chitinophagaceae bacterium]|nr:hypothetical protein [Chitinophagaceae bacterium]